MLFNSVAGIFCSPDYDKNPGFANRLRPDVNPINNLTADD